VTNFDTVFAVNFPWFQEPHSRLQYLRPPTHVNYFCKPSHVESQNIKQKSPENYFNNPLVLMLPEKILYSLNWICVVSKDTKIQTPLIFFSYVQRKALNIVHTSMCITEINYSPGLPAASTTWRGWKPGRILLILVAVKASNLILKYMVWDSSDTKRRQCSNVL
jgi:hypothetical protein